MVLTNLKRSPFIPYNIWYSHSKKLNLLEKFIVASFGLLSVFCVKRSQTTRKSYNFNIDSDHRNQIMGVKHPKMKNLHFHVEIPSLHMYPQD